MCRGSIILSMDANARNTNMSVSTADRGPTGSFPLTALRFEGGTRVSHVVSVFNRYLFRGGEEEVFESEARMLQARGVRVTPICIQTTAPPNAFDKAKLGLQSIWSWEWHSRFTDLLSKDRPDVVHVHNSFPVLSPAIYYASRRLGIPVVQTLHNYRLLCPGALFFRDGKVCEDCLEGGLLHGIRHGCYRGSRAQTAVVAIMLRTHRALDTWNEKVDLYIALTEFARQKFILGGLPAERVIVKSNFLDPDPGVYGGPRQGAVFAGRLSDQKGLLTLLDAWRRMSVSFPLTIIGEGPLHDDLHARKTEAGLANVTLMGRISRGETVELIRRSRFLILPSMSYENFPLTLVEAFACGVPVIASRLGAMAEIVDDGRTGLLFRAGDPADLAEKASWAFGHPLEMEAMSCASRAEFLAKYTADTNFDQLMRIYSAVLGQKAAAVA
jgi:glycosyltransferase involved in cell wall biosynthesis